MIDVMLRCKFDNTDVGHHTRCNHQYNSERSLFKTSRTKKQNPFTGSRHPFNIITEEIYD